MNKSLLRDHSFLLLGMALSVPCIAQAQANQFLDDTTIQTINLTMDPNDWAALQQNYLLDTDYHATFSWNGITESIGLRAHGGGSRSPIKPNLNFAIYTKTQTFLGLPFVLIKANNEDPSNLREWISMKLFRQMGLPAPREVAAQVFLNGQILGMYFVVEHEDETFLGRNFGESGGCLYEWQQNGLYEFNNLGADSALYAGLAPGFEGLYQVNTTVQPTWASGTRGGCAHCGWWGCLLAGFALSTG